MALLIDKEAWMAGAACRDMPPGIFYPDIIGDNGEEFIDDGTNVRAVADLTPWYKEALDVCDTCPVRNDCLTYALEHREAYGCWGGKTPVERQRILRNTRRAALILERSLEDGNH